MVLNPRLLAVLRHTAWLLMLPVGMSLAAAAKPGVKPSDDADEVAQPGLKTAPHLGQYVVREADPKGLELAAPKLPDLAPYTAAAVQAKVDKIKAGPKGHIRYERLVEAIELTEFTGGDGRLVEWAAAQRSNPRAIIIDGGYLTPADLLKMLPRDEFEETAEGVFLLRMPLIVAHNATFHIDSKTREFRMSEERGAFLVNDGKLFITNSALISWREKTNSQAMFVDKEKFRPFLLSWGGTETYIVGSKVKSLGYAKSKSYGVSISQYSPSIADQMKRTRPTGWLLDSEFSDNWYGFYCFEADNVVIARNVYRDNILYGIDPHDRSRGLIIAENDAYGTHKKHGIIVSREVNNSWIFRNRAHGNALSGIVLDRSSINNVVADNTTFGNHSDGITIYESSDNLLWNNHAVGNERHGIRVRNSMRVRLYNNRCIGNGSNGVYGHIKDLNGTDRDLALDPFTQSVSLVVVGGQLTHNDSGPVAIDSPLSLELYDVNMLAPTKAAGLKMVGILGELQAQVLDLLVRKGVPVVIEPAAGAGRRGT